MYLWITGRLPQASDADPQGLVRWGGAQRPGLLLHWQEVRPGEPWTHSACWTPAEELREA